MDSEEIGTKLHDLIKQFGIKRLYENNEEEFHAEQVSEDSFKVLVSRLKKRKNTLVNNPRVLYIILNGLGMSFEELVTGKNNEYLVLSKKVLNLEKELSSIKTNIQYLTNVTISKKRVSISRYKLIKYLYTIYGVYNKSKTLDRTLFNEIISSNCNNLIKNQKSYAVLYDDIHLYPLEIYLYLLLLIVVLYEHAVKIYDKQKEGIHSYYKLLKKTKKTCTDLIMFLRKTIPDKVRSENKLSDSTSEKKIKDMLTSSIQNLMYDNKKLYDIFSIIKEFEQVEANSCKPSNSAQIYKIYIQKEYEQKKIIINYNVIDSFSNFEQLSVSIKNESQQ